MAGGPAGYDVFLSYSRRRSGRGERSCATGWSTTASSQVFIDWRALLAGRPWQPALEAALAGCRAMVVLIGPMGIGGWQHREIQLGLDRQTGARRRRRRSRSSPCCCPAWSPTTTRSAAS